MTTGGDQPYCRPTEPGGSRDGRVRGHRDPEYLAASDQVRDRRGGGVDGAALDELLTSLTERHLLVRRKSPASRRSSRPGAAAAQWPDEAAGPQRLS